MNKKQQVIQAIRKQLPRLMESCTYDISKKTPNPNELIKYEGNLGFSEMTFDYICNENNIGWGRAKSGDLDCFTIWKRINLEPTILNALECLNEKRGVTIHEQLTINYEGQIIKLIENYGSLNCRIHYTGYEFKLSTPNIADQSEETINFLHSVLC